ncbi:MAG TPA: hypothetical protein VGO16_01310 [Pseudonocardiaceae bacterium]|nr:hypothetical protein [Pseudonocardiaceae bacterium]
MARRGVPSRLALADALRAAQCQQREDPRNFSDRHQAEWPARCDSAEDDPQRDEHEEGNTSNRRRRVFDAGAPYPQHGAPLA